jgi:endogenous inhibitor of DNA gyrase (YacG/DUF329 family)
MELSATLNVVLVSRSTSSVNAAPAYKECNQLQAKHQKVPAKFMGMVYCPYCGKPALSVTGEKVYPHRKDLWKKQFFLCSPCEAYVGCHEQSGKPLGRLANAELRRAKKDAHSAFDPSWQSCSVTRTEAYAWLAEAMHLQKHQCHIGELAKIITALLGEKCPHCEAHGHRESSYRYARGWNHLCRQASSGGRGKYCESCHQVYFETSDEEFLATLPDWCTYRGQPGRGVKSGFTDYDPLFMGVRNV